MSLAVTAEPESQGQSQASGSSFYMAMRLLPKAEREAMFAVYAFCRQVDDIADEPGPTREERRALLNAWREDIDQLYAGRPGPLARPLEVHVRRFGMAREDFHGVIDGMEMDVDGPIQAPDFRDLDLYCDRVASAVGRLSVKIFGMEDGCGWDLAHHLGRALQFTNILRDLDEDAAADRLYLPREALQTAGMVDLSPAAVVAHPALDTACRWLADRARGHYGEVDKLITRRPRGRLRAARLMSGVYGAILGRMIAEGWGAPRRRVSVERRQLLWIVATRGLAK
jgi:phytoene synthase